ncbi:SH3 domain-containing protein [Streptomyces noursei]|uniref:SH3 domain-containing protein n=1 Tax=Streptomyces noursei TaxID=1971 RepID=UPI0037FB4743
MSHKLARRAASVALSAGLLAGGSIALAAPASAVGSSACTSSKVYAHGHYANSAPARVANGQSLKFRAGPGKGYTAKGLLTPWTHFYATCSAKNYSWSYGKVTSGVHKGEWGWVYSWGTTLGLPG